MLQVVPTKYRCFTLNSRHFTAGIKFLGFVKNEEVLVFLV
jgi:hypothetical protein